MTVDSVDYATAAKISQVIVESLDRIYRLAFMIYLVVLSRGWQFCRNSRFMNEIKSGVGQIGALCLFYIMDIMTDYLIEIDIIVLLKDIFMFAVYTSIIIGSTRKTVNDISVKILLFYIIYN